jgi:hypothetical protein
MVTLTFLEGGSPQLFLTNRINPKSEISNHQSPESPIRNPNSKFQIPQSSIFNHQSLAAP